MTVNLVSRIALGVVLGLFATCSLLAEDQVVVKKDGTKIVGEVVKNGDNYTIKTNLGEVTVPVKDVDRIEMTPQAAFAKKVAELKDDDPNIAQKRYDLAKSAFDQGLFKEALEQLKILEQSKWGNDPFYQRIGPKLKEQVEGAMGGKTTETPTVTPKETPTETPKPNLENIDHDLMKGLLTQEQISRVRLEELDKDKDKNVVVVFKAGKLAEFMNKLQGKNGYDANEFRKMKPIDQLWFLLDNLSGSDREDVKNSVSVNTDPKFMVDFKASVWPVIKNNCASANCHGGTKGKGGFYLYSGGGGMADRQMYTNFVILRGYNKGSAMLDVQQPDKSLLLCHSLPRDKTENKHPYANQAEVNTGGGSVGPIEIQYACTSKDDEKYKKMYTWISNLQLLMRVDYNLGDWKPWGMDPHFFQLKPSVQSVLGQTRPAGK